MKLLLGAAMALAVLPAWAQAPKGDPKVAECRAANQKAHAEVAKAYADAQKAGMIGKAEAKAHSRTEARLAKHRAALEQGGLTLAECETIGKDIAKERAEVARMAKSPPRKK